jgi:hypothetical protein
MIFRRAGLHDTVASRRRPGRAAITEAGRRELVEAKS